MQSKLAQRRQWLEDFTLSWVNTRQSVGNLVLEPLAGDASSRRYFDIKGIDGDFLAVDTPLENKPEEFVKTSLLFEKLDIKCPKVECVDLENGFFIVDKITPSLPLYDYLQQNSQQQNKVRTAIDTSVYNLIKMHSVAAKPEWTPEFGRQLMQAEIQLFDVWFLKSLLGLKLTDTRVAQLQRIYATTIEKITMQPQVLVHRDYHSRNLLVTADDNIAVLDFQDAVWGPISYDIVSLAFDCYVNYTQANRFNICKNYMQTMVEHNLIGNNALNNLNCWVNSMVVQRYLKVMGIFSRLFIRDNKKQYLQYLPFVLDTVIAVTQQQQEMQLLHNFLKLEVKPAFYSTKFYEYESDVVTIENDTFA